VTTRRSGALRGPAQSIGAFLKEQWQKKQQQPTQTTTRRDDAAGLGFEELAWRAKQGCQASFAELIHRYAPRLHVFLRRKTRDHHEVEDLVQDTFIKAYQILAGMMIVEVSTWLFTIARRLAVSRRRKREPRSSTLDLRMQVCAG